MIAVFSGMDGVGKSTQLKRMLNKCEMEKINYRVLYVRGGNTPLAREYKRLINFFCKKGNLSQRIVNIGINIAIFELFYYWGIRLRYLEKKSQIVLCDRYLWDTYVDFVQKYNYRETRLWSKLVDFVPKPKVSILYMADERTIYYRLQKRNIKEEINICTIKQGKHIYEWIQEKYDYVLDANKLIDDLFQDTLNCFV